ncbi:hypothetical protein GQ457_13G011150 [Hibiscus cannabinus]
MVNLCTLDTESSSCTCHCSTAVTLSPGAQGVAQPQVNLASATKGLWFVDSSASHHVSPDSNNLLNSSYYSGPGKLTVDNGKTLAISRIGQYALISSSSSRTLHLNNVLHVPSVTKNLVSVSKLGRDNNVFLEFHASSCVVRDEGTSDVLLTGDEVDGLYRFNSCLFRPTSCNKQSLTEINVAYNCIGLYELWHRRLGHASREHEQVCSSSISVVPGVEKLWRVIASSVDHIGSNESSPIDDNVTVLTPQPRGAHPDGGCVGTVVHTTNSVLPASPMVAQLRVSSPIMQSPKLTDGSSASGTRLTSYVVDDSHVSLHHKYLPSQLQLMKVNHPLRTVCLKICQ